MELKIISTGSVGNCYILDSGKEQLLIECGVHIDKIKKALNFNYSNVVGCIVTHEHKDHAKSINEVCKLGINVFATKGTFNEDYSYSHRKEILKAHKQIQISNFIILPFDVKHDAAEPVGFIIYHPDCGKTLFLTDTYYCEYKFSGLNNIIIEANYSLDILQQKFGADVKMEFLRNRILRSHLSIENCINLLKANDLSNVNNIVLIHLSDSNSNELEFKAKVSEATVKNITVASNNTQIKFNKTPF